MIHYYFGDGKGKTSAAVGACARAAGAGFRCAFAQFHKSGSSSEVKMLEKIGADIYAVGDKAKFYKDMNEEEKILISAIHNENLRHLISIKYDFIVLDELGDAVLRNTADTDIVRKLLEKPDCEIIITGHKSVEMFIDAADYLTEFRCLAHPYKKGIKARRGIEF